MRWKNGILFTLNTPIKDNVVSMAREAKLRQGRTITKLMPQRYQEHLEQVIRFNDLKQTEKDSNEFFSKLRGN